MHKKQGQLTKVLQFCLHKADDCTQVCIPLPCNGIVVMMVVVVIGTLMLLVVARALVIALVLLSPLAALWGL